MADKEDKKPKAPKGDKADKAPPSEKAEKAERAKAAKAAPKGATTEREPEPKGPSRLRKQFDEVIRAHMVEKFGYKNPMEVPRLTKITLNMGVGEAVGNKKILENAVADMAKIAGQKPITTLSRKAHATFKIRENWPIGCKVTLRRHKMYEFLDRLINISLPRVRDFRGVSGRAFDGRGNYNMGVKEQIIFPEIDFDQIDALRGMDIAITTTAKSDEEAKALLEAFRFPFRN